jgi:hypothetical protein
LTNIASAGDFFQVQPAIKKKKGGKRRRKEEKREEKGERESSE